MSVGTKVIEVYSLNAFRKKIAYYKNIYKFKFIDIQTYAITNEHGLHGRAYFAVIELLQRKDKPKKLLEDSDDSIFSST